MEELPAVIKETFREQKPEATEQEGLQFSLDSYLWEFEHYMENWAADLSHWWMAPPEYRLGKVPEGGHVWVRMQLSKEGKLLGYRVYPSRLSTEMEVAVINALIGSLDRPPLPASFPKDHLVINWKFIYPPLRQDWMRKRPRE